MVSYDIDAEFSYYEKFAQGNTGENIRVRPITAKSEMPNELGYTAADGVIHLCIDHPMMNELSVAAKRFFRKGIFSHEFLHQKLTSFSILHNGLKKYPRHEQEIVATIFNIMEDPAIEEHAPYVLGNSFVKALRFSIAWIYKQTRPLEVAQNALSQFINACIMFGDMGPLKGNFTFPEAQNCFKEAAPIIYQCIHEPFPLERFKLVEKVVEISRPLWQAEVDLKKLLDELSEELAQIGKNVNSNLGGSNPVVVTPKGNMNQKKQNRQQATISQQSTSNQSQDEQNEVQNESQQKTTASEFQNESLQEQENQSSEQNTSDPVTEKQDETQAGNIKGLSQDEEHSSEEDTSSEQNGSTSEQEKTEEESGAQQQTSDGTNQNDEVSEQETLLENQSQNPGTPVPSLSIQDEDWYTIEFNEEDYQIDPDDLKDFEEEIEYYRKQVEKERKQEQELNGEPEQFPITSPAYQGRIVCTNINVIADQYCATIYHKLVGELSPSIHTLTNQLKRILLEDQEERVYKTSGKLNVDRFYSGRVTSRVFQKVNGPNGKRDMAVCILVDESASMGNDKSRAARDAAIVLAETMHNLGVPIYVMGFTTEVLTDDPIHYHYIKWKNTDTERSKLVTLSSRDCNFDSYSIRYAGELLKRRKESHRLLFVLSDGTPNSVHYRPDTAISDTYNAIHEVRKYADVFGIAIGDTDATKIMSMYGSDFIHINDVESLSSGIGKKMKKIINRW